MTRMTEKSFQYNPEILDQSLASHNEELSLRLPILHRLDDNRIKCLPLGGAT
jgi:hypothetical protein